MRISWIDKFVIKQILKGILGIETSKTFMLLLSDEFETSAFIKS